METELLGPMVFKSILPTIIICFFSCTGNLKDSDHLNVEEVVLLENQLKLELIRFIDDNDIANTHCGIRVDVLNVNSIYRVFNVSTTSNIIGENFATYKTSLKNVNIYFVTGIEQYFITNRRQEIDSVDRSDCSRDLLISIIDSNSTFIVLKDININPCDSIIPSSWFENKLIIK